MRVRRDQDARAAEMRLDLLNSCCLYVIQTTLLRDEGSRRLTKVSDSGNSARGASTRKGSRLRMTHSSTPRHSARATRTAGQSMRSRLLDAASALFKAHGLNGTSITAIAGASDAFP